MIHLKQAARSLARTPFLTAVAVLSLALGIGANAAVFSMVEQLLLRALPVVEPDRLVNLVAPGPKPGSQNCNVAGDCSEVLSYPMYRDLEREHPGLTGVAGHRAISVNLAVDERAVQASGMLVSGTYFPLLGVRPALGRMLQPADDQVPGEHAVAVLGHAFWQNRLGGDPDVLNRPIVVNGRPLTVVGVAAPTFHGTTFGERPDVYVPLTMREALEGVDAGFDERRSYWIYAFGRLAPGVSPEPAAAALNQLYSGIIQETELELQTRMTAADLEAFAAKPLILRPGDRGQSRIDEEAGGPILFMMVVTVLVLLIACANIANLLLARGARRQTELAIRNSLGAHRWQLIRQLLAEALLLAALGGVAALGVARGTLVLIGSMMPIEARTVMATEIRWPVLLFTAAVALGTALLFGLYPAFRATRTALVTTLRNTGGQTSGGRSSARFRTWLVTAQIALSLALLIGAGLFVRSLANVSRVDLGMAADNVVTFGVSPARNGYDGQQSRTLFRRLEEELGGLPGVTGVTASSIPLLADSDMSSDISVQGFRWNPGMDANASWTMIGPGFFRTLGIPLLAGREFTPADEGEDFTVAIVNQSFLEKFGLDRSSALGTMMAQGTGDGVELDVRIVGVVADALYNNVKDGPPPAFYVPYRQDEQRGRLTFYVRTAGDPVPVLAAVPGVLQRLDPTLPMDELKTLRQQARDNVFMDRMVSGFAAALAVLATLLAAIGLYGVVSFAVTQRTREFGLRMALGAASPEIRSLVLGQVGRMLLVGGTAGILGALALGQAASSLLFRMKGHDLASFAGALAVLALVTLAAAWIPARKAARVNPLQALRYD